jgi:hypothetical protein
MMETKDTSEPDDAQPARKTYETPRLVSYGSITKLTQGSATVGTDGGLGMMNMQCL